MQISAYLIIHYLICIFKHNFSEKLYCKTIALIKNKTTQEKYIYAACKKMKASQ